MKPSKVTKEMDADRVSSLVSSFHCDQVSGIHTPLFE